jgi:hypothetical protein
MSEAQAQDRRLVATVDAMLAKGGLTPEEADFLRGVRHRKSANAGRRRRWRMTPSAVARFWQIHGRVMETGEGEGVAGNGKG